MPKVLRKRVQKLLSLLNPQRKAVSLMVRLLVRRMYREKSSRTMTRYLWGDTPVSCLNRREK